MSENRKIFINILATFGSTIFGIICGLLTCRWLFLALGKVDYGLLNLIVGITSCIAFLNGVLATSVGRFISFSVGESKNDAEAGLKKAQAWFNTAILIHTVLPIILLLIGYPIGIYVIKNYLNIPPDRVSACLWLFLFTAISIFFTMLYTPYRAMYYAKQKIAELTIYGYFTTVINMGYLYYIVTHSGDYLALTGLIGTILALVPIIITTIRAYYIFPECRIKREYLYSPKRLKEVIKFTTWSFWGCLGGQVQQQGSTIFINKFFGPLFNTSLAISRNVSDKMTIFAHNVNQVFSPAITTECGKGNYDNMRILAYRCCKISTLLILALTIPTVLELKFILNLWLGGVQDFTVTLSYFILAQVIISRLSIGHMYAVNAYGKIALYHTILGGVALSSLPLMFLFYYLNCGAYAIAYSLLISTTMCSVGRVIFAKYLVRMSISYWIKTILIPISITVILSLATGLVIKTSMPESLLRVAIIAIVTEVIFLALTWLFTLERYEKIIIKEQILKQLRRFKIILASRESCTGCGACYLSCPQQAIQMIADENGFRYPKIDKNKCIKCKLCVTICPISTPIKLASYENEYYMAKNFDEGIRAQSSSGGLFTIFAEKTLAEGGVVFGAKFTEDWDVAHSYTENLSSLNDFRGSKYVESYLGDCYSKVKEFLVAQRMVLFSGTPCQIAGLKKFLRQDYDNLLTIELICHGVPAPNIWQEHLAYIRQKHNMTNITAVSFKDKTKGWDNFHMKIIGDNNKCYFVPKLEDPYIKSFFENCSLRNSCFRCCAKKGSSGADITLGDFWRKEYNYPEYDDNKGVSVVIINNPHGKEAWKKISNKVQFDKVSYEAVILSNRCYVESVKTHKTKYSTNMYVIKEYCKGL